MSTKSMKDEKIKTMDDISDLETITYKWSRQISEFNHDSNREILIQFCKYDNYMEQILYVVSVIELLGAQYITFAISLHENNVMIHNKNNNYFNNAINKYTDFKRYSAASYTMIMRSAVKVIYHKYFLCTKSFSLH